MAGAGAGRLLVTYFSADPSLGGLGDFLLDDLFSVVGLEASFGGGESVRLKSLRIQNFRSFKDETIELGGYTCFVGPNGTGKSSVLVALNVFFRETANPTDVTLLKEEDFHLKNTSRPIVITVTFVDLSPAAEQDLKAYVRHGQLVVSAKATWESERGCAEVKQYGSRLVLEALAPFFEAEKAGEHVAELRTIYQGLRGEFSDLPKVSTKRDMAESLRQYEEGHEKLCTLQESSDQFYGWSKGANRLGAHCQWIFVPAVKDAVGEEREGRATALGRLLQRTIRSKVGFEVPLQGLMDDVEVRYREIIEGKQQLLSDLSSSLEQRLKDWAHPGARVELKWHFDEERSVVINEPVAKVAIGEGPFTGEVARLGHGIQRSFIVSLLQELAASDGEGQPELILGLEEPELYQHPPQARHLAALLERLTQDQGQVLVTSHSPYFVTGTGFESIRLTRKDRSGETHVSFLTHAKLSERLAAALERDPVAPSNVMAVVEQIMQPSQNELFFSRVPVLVEGVEDVAFISTHLHLLGHWEKFRRYGCHFVVCGGKGPMSRPLAIALGLSLNPFVVFDGDGDHAGEEERHRRDNGCLLRLVGLGGEETFPSHTVWSDRLVMWHRRLEREIRDEVGDDGWERARSAAFEALGFSESPSPKNTLWIAGTLEGLQQEGIQSEQLEKLCQAILEHAKGVLEQEAKATQQPSAVDAGP